MSRERRIDLGSAGPWRLVRRRFGRHRPAAVALRVLSSCTPAQFKRYVLDGNADALKATVKGIGAKTASRLIVELRERVEQLPVAAESAAGQAARDAVQALVALGEPHAEAERLVRAAVAKLGPDADRQKLVEEALGS